MLLITTLLESIIKRETWKKLPPGSLTPLLIAPPLGGGLYSYYKYKKQQDQYDSMPKNPSPLEQIKQYTD